MQSFSLTQPGGGAVILQKLIDFATSYNYQATVAVDVNDIPEQCVESSQQKGELKLNILNRRLRFGFGRMVGFIAGTALDFVSIKRIKQLLHQQQPSVVHITAHGITFPLFFKAAKLWGKAKVVVSVHDLWTLSVRKYLPNWLAKKILASILPKVDACYVISIEMGQYLQQQFGLKDYLIIHDGYMPEADRQEVMPTKQKRLRFLYVGLLHDIQLNAMANLMEAMASLKDAYFTIGVCSNTTLEKKGHHDNIEIINYGWVDSKQLAEISNDYAFGLLPLSFNQKDALFYRTSLMTKIPFYLKQQLPILCIGPADSASIQLLYREQNGICVVEEGVQALQNSLSHISNMSEAEYHKLIDNSQKSIEQTFNAAIIAQRFYKSF